MTDIVERLRDTADMRHMDRGNDAVDDIMREAADEIERLRLSLSEIIVTTFNRGDYVRKKSGAFWEGTVVGDYSTKQTADGVAVQLFGWPDGPVQIYPAAALEFAGPGDPLSDARDTGRREGMEWSAQYHDDLAAQHEACGWESQHHEMMARGHRRFAAAIRAAMEK